MARRTTEQTKKRRRIFDNMKRWFLFAGNKNNNRASRTVVETLSLCDNDDDDGACLVRNPAAPVNKKPSSHGSCCCICMTEPKPSKAASIDGCQHVFCFQCIEEWSTQKNTCPLCLKKFSKICSRKRTKRVRDVIGDNNQHPTTISNPFEDDMARRLTTMTVNPIEDDMISISPLPDRFEPSYTMDEMPTRQEFRRRRMSLLERHPNYLLNDTTILEQGRDEYRRALRRQNTGETNFLNIRSYDDTPLETSNVYDVSTLSYTNFHELQEEEDEDVAMAKAISISEVAGGGSSEVEVALQAALVGRRNISDNTDDDDEQKMPSLDERSSTEESPTAATHSPPARSGSSRTNDTLYCMQEMFVYLNKVKREFQDDPHVYNTFLELMAQYEDAQQNDIPRIIERIITLFVGHNDLIFGFNALLPEGYEHQITMQDIINCVQQQSTCTPEADDGPMLINDEQGRIVANNVNRDRINQFIFGHQDSHV